MITIVSGLPRSGTSMMMRILEAGDPAAILAGDAANTDQIARIRTEKRKGNRTVTLITGLEHVGNDLPTLCTELRQSLGVGGSVQGRTIELQGDLAKKVGHILEVDKGYKIRLG